MIDAAILRTSVSTATTAITLTNKITTSTIFSNVMVWFFCLWLFVFGIEKKLNPNQPLRMDTYGLVSTFLPNVLG